jgi:hypothetical protein
VASVAFDKVNMDKCNCKMCPVQEKSACSAEKKAKLMAPMQPGMEMMMPSAADFPGLYCSTGVATCEDLDQTKGCICPSCAVWTDNKLTAQKYCERGSATVIG